MVHAYEDRMDSLSRATLLAHQDPFAMLVLFTRECPCASIFPHSQPHQLDSGVYSGVTVAVEGVKNLASEG